MKLNINKYIIAISLSAFFVLPISLHAAFITASSVETVSAGDTTIISVFLNTEGSVINSIDGSLVLSDEHNGNFEIRDISLSNSVMTMWPRKPSLEAGLKIVFVGGVPGGVNGNNLLLFKVIVKINESGVFNVKPSEISAYLNDGLGTAVKIDSKLSSIKVDVKKGGSKDSWQNIISKDNFAPLPFKISLNQDSNLFDGKKFISFETTDVDSGINYYEVKEGINDPVRSGTDYVLIDQNIKKDIVVTAYDKAGNFQVSVLKGEDRIHWVSVIVSLIVLIVIYKVINKIRTRNKDKINAK